MSKQPEALTLASAMTTASIVICGLPELSGYNGAVLLIDDTERDRIVKDAEDAAAELRRLHSLNAELLTALQMMVEVHGVRWEHAKADQSIPIGWVHLTNVALAVIEKAEAQQ